MLEIIFIALFQSAAGEPAPATVEQPTEESQPAEAETRTRAAQRRCSLQVTGSRLPVTRNCRAETQQEGQEEDTRQTLHQAQQPAPIQSN